MDSEVKLDPDTLSKSSDMSRRDFLRMSSLILLGIFATGKLGEEYFISEPTVEKDIPIGKTGKSTSIVYGNHFTDTPEQTFINIKPSLMFYEAVNLLDKPIDDLNPEELLQRIKSAFDGTNQQTSLEFSINNNIPILFPDLTLNNFIDPQVVQSVLGFLLTSEVLSPVFSPLYDKLFADEQPTSKTIDTKSPKMIEIVSKALLTAPLTSETLLMFSRDRKAKNVIRTINNQILPFIDTLKGQGRDIVYAAKMHMLVDNQFIKDNNSVSQWGGTHILQPFIVQDTESTYKLIHDNRHWLKMFYSHESLCNIVQFTDITNNNEVLSGKMDVIHLDKMEELLKD